MQSWEELICCQKRKTQELESVKYAYFDYSTKIPQTQLFQDIDVFIHCGSCTDYTQSKKYMLEQNVLSLKNIQKISATAKHFIYISSSSVYQWLWWKISSNVSIDENNLENSYSYSKYKAEEYIRWNFTNTYISILRPRAIYWKGDTTLVPQVLQNSFFWYLLLPWDWKSRTSVSEVWGFCQFIYKISQQKASWIYNYASDILTYNEIYRKIQNDYQKKGIIYIPMWIFKTLYLHNRNKYSYIIDTFSKDKIL